MNRILRKAVALLPLCLVTACDIDEPLIGGYKFSAETETAGVIARWPMSNDGPYIPCNVVRYEHDDRYIVARQYAKYPCLPGVNRAVLAPQRLGETYYWIIDTKTISISGPFDETTFLDRVRKLALPKTLQRVREKWPLDQVGMDPARQ